MYDTRGFEDLVGKTITAVIEDDRFAIHFVCDDGSEMRMYHEQDCCESVSVDDVSGDWDDIIGTPVLVAEERTSDAIEGEEARSIYDDSVTWTFYTIRTIKGTVDIRWYGTSNGYYSEDVNCRWEP